MRIPGVLCAIVRRAHFTDKFLILFIIPTTTTTTTATT